MTCQIVSTAICQSINADLPESSCRASSDRRRSCPRSSARGLRTSCASRGLTPAFTARPGHQQRHVLARVIGARRRRIVAVIRRDRPADRRARSRGSRSFSRASNRSRFAAYPATSLRCPYSVSKSTRFAKISPRAVDAISRQHGIHALVVALRVDGARDAAPREQVVDLADRDDRNVRRRQTIEHRFDGRHHREVPAVGRPREASRLRRRTGAR